MWVIYCINITEVYNVVARGHYNKFQILAFIIFLPFEWKCALISVIYKPNEECFFLFVNFIRQVLFCHIKFPNWWWIYFFKFKLLYWKWDHLRNAIFITRIKVVEVYKYTGKRFQLSISGSNFQKKDSNGYSLVYMQYIEKGGWYKHYIKNFYSGEWCCLLN